MENKNFNWRPVSEYTGGRVLATNGLDVLIGEINSEGDCESEEGGSTILCGITGFIKIEEILPESEDEKIRKDIVFYIAANHKDDGEKARWLYWLEKQGEQKPIVIIPKFRVGDVIRPKGSMAEYTIESISGEHYHGKGWKLHTGCDNDYELVEQKPAWSEEDNKALDSILNDLKQGVIPDNDDIDWLNSLKERYTWKPSNEHIKRLNNAINILESLNEHTDVKYLKDIKDKLLEDAPIPKIEKFNADAFIEKATTWLREQEEMVGVSFQDDFIERFKNYMKG